MAVAFVIHHNNASSTSSGTTLAPVPASNTTPGNLLALAVVYDNITATTPGVSSISVPSGETAAWVPVASGFQPAVRFISSSGSSGGSVIGDIFVIKTTIAWPSGVSITVTLSSAVSARACVWSEFSGVESIVTCFSEGHSLASASSAVTSGNVPIRSPKNGDLVLGLIGHESNTDPAADTDTLNGSWNAGVFTHTGSGGAASNVGLRLQYKILTADGDQTLNKSDTTDGGCTISCLAATGSFRSLVLDQRRVRRNALLRR